MNGWLRTLNHQFFKFAEQVDQVAAIHSVGNGADDKEQKPDFSSFSDPL